MSSYFPKLSFERQLSLSTVFHKKKLFLLLQKLSSIRQLDLRKYFLQKSARLFKIFPSKPIKSFKIFPKISAYCLKVFLKKQLVLETVSGQKSTDPLNGFPSKIGSSLKSFPSKASSYFQKLPFKTTARPFNSFLPKICSIVKHVIHQKSVRL